MLPIGSDVPRFGRDILKGGIRMNISDGSYTLIWHDPWVPDIPGFHVVRPLHCPPHVRWMADLIDRHNLDWNHQLVH